MYRLLEMLHFELCVSTVKQITTTNVKYDIYIEMQNQPRKPEVFKIEMVYARYKNYHVTTN